MKQKNTWWRTAILLAASLLAAHAEQPPSKGSTASEPIPVRVQQLAARNLEQALEYVGDIKGQDEATVYSKVPGKIAEKLKEDGAEVQKDEPIAYVDRDEVGFKFEKAPVESPLAGVIGRVYVDRGSSVTPQTPVALVVNLDQVEIDLGIPEKYLPRIQVGQTADIRVDAYAKGFTGTITKVSPIVDLQTRTAPVEIVTPNPEHELKPGMFARVRLIMEQRTNILTVPKESVLGPEADPYVYVVRDNFARQQKVRLGLRQASDYEVLEGLQAGDLVVIMGQQRLTEGARVVIEQRNGTASPAAERREERTTP